MECLHLWNGRQFRILKVILVAVYSLSPVWLFWDCMDCNPPGSSVQGISQARILKCVVISFSRGCSPPRDQIWVSCLAGRLLHFKKILYLLSHQGSPKVILLSTSRIQHWGRSQLRVCKSVCLLQFQPFQKASFWVPYTKMSANLENSAVATGLEKVSFHSNSKERQCQRMLKLPHNCTHLTC